LPVRASLGPIFYGVVDPENPESGYMDSFFTYYDNQPAHGWYQYCINSRAIGEGDGFAVFGQKSTEVDFGIKFFESEPESLLPGVSTFSTEAEFAAKSNYQVGRIFIPDNVWVCVFAQKSRGVSSSASVSVSAWLLPIGI